MRVLSSDVHLCPSCRLNLMSISRTDLALGAAATARLARLATRDSLLDEPRLRYVRRMDRTGHSKLAELAVCPWCISVWIGGIIAFAAHKKIPGYELVTAALTFSLAAGLINEIGAESSE